MKITHSQVMVKRINEKSVDEKPVTKARFFRRRKYVDPAIPSLVWDACRTYEENKHMCLKAIGDVARGEYKNIWEAHADYCD